MSSLETFAPGYLAAHGLGYDAAAGTGNSKLILVSLTGFGQDGPYAHYKAPDIVGNAMGALLYISGDPKMTPCNPPETQAYYYASLFACYGTMLALWQREMRGIGAWIDASMQASMALHEHVAFNYSAEEPGDETRRQPASAQRAGEFVSVQERLDRACSSPKRTGRCCSRFGTITIRRSTIPSGSIATCAGSRPTTSTPK